SAMVSGGWGLRGALVYLLGEGGSRSAWTGERRIGGLAEGALALTGSALATDPASGRSAMPTKKGIEVFVGKPDPSGAETPSPLTSLAMTKGLIASTATDGKLRLFAADPLDLKATLDGHAAEALAVAVSGDGKRIATADAAGKLLVWAEGKDKPQRTVDAHGAPILALAMTADGKRIATAAVDGSVKAWDADTGKETHSWPARRAMPAWAAAFSPDGKTLAVGAGTALERFDLGKPGEEPKDKTAIGRGFKFRAAAVDKAKGYALVIPAAGTAVLRQAFPEAKPEGVGRLDRTAYALLLDRSNGRAYVLRSAEAPSAGLHPRGKGVALLAYDADRLAAKAGKGGEPRAKAALEGTISCPVLSPDGKRIFCLESSKSQVLRIDAETLEESGKLELKHAPQALSLSPDGKRLVVLAEGEGGNARLLEVDPERMAESGSAGLKQPAHDVAAGDGGIVVVAGRDALQRIDLKRPDRPLRTVPSEGVRHRVRVSADGRTAFLFPEKAAPCVFHVWPMDGSAGGRVTLPAGAITGEGAEFALSEDGSHLYSGRGAVLTIPERWLKRKP
ncbi:MAG: hypothetical protein K2W96_26160, partial [Gemmataceae bacterium]|nr:hypothetical protein [Gemmataceae bacterium]